MSSDSLALRLETLAMQRFGCDHCGKRFPDHGFCPDCPDEPLLDLADSQVRELICKEASEDMLVAAPRVQHKFAGPILFAIIALTAATYYSYLTYTDYIKYLVTETWGGIFLGIGLIVVVILFWIWEIKTRVYVPRITSKLAQISQEEWNLLAMLNENEN